MPSTSTRLGGRRLLSVGTSPSRLVISARGPSLVGPTRVASLEPVAGDGPGAAGCGCRGRPSALAPPRCGCCGAAGLVCASAGAWRWRPPGRWRQGPVAVAAGVLGAQAQQAEHLPVVLPLDLLGASAGSRRLFARGLPVAGGRRGAAHECELSDPRSAVQAKRIAPFSLTVPTREDAARRGEKTGLKSREGGRTLQLEEAGWAPGYLSPYQAMPRWACRPSAVKAAGETAPPLLSFSVLRKATGSGVAAPANGQCSE